MGQVFFLPSCPTCAVLQPHDWASQEVLCLVAAMARKQHEREGTSRWWLSPSFAEIALNPTGYDPNMLALIRKRFMGLADKLRQVYVPMLRGKHWYLMIVDMYQTSLIYLDSLKYPEDTAELKKQMKYVKRGFMSSMMATLQGALDMSGLSQPLDNNLTRAQWMMQANLWGDHDLPRNWNGFDYDSEPERALFRRRREARRARQAALEQ
ncbi:hypothetical protein PIB30_033923 [Stylosanthes scabra]|uniref:Ubiquitin-like protease family profile domain-containing protein n=1 Tax=Stylosanthes scabra TaxID=79078 RepID=A0ABU6XEA1_9FABA|nr:hypothetical protein [Stylosanthes scabra]